jgi:hypothetical protein
MTDVDNTTATPVSPVDGAQDPSNASEGQDTLLTSDPSSASEPTVPETYKLSLPDDSPLDPTALDRVTSLAKSLKVTSDESAQAIAQAIHQEVTTYHQSQLEANAKGGALWKARVGQLEKQALADPDIGGTPERLQQAVQHSRQVLDRFGDTSVRDFLEESGLGSSPALIKMLTRIHRAMGEDTFVTASVAPKAAPKSLAERIYG